MEAKGGNQDPPRKKKGEKEEKLLFSYHPIKRFLVGLANSLKASIGGFFPKEYAQGRIGT